MDTDLMIVNLRKVAKEHENDPTFTGQTIISVMCNDVANRLEEQLAEINKLKKDYKELKKEYDNLRYATPSSSYEENSENNLEE